MSTLLFNTHHAPIGAYMSLTFGKPGVSVSIDHEAPSVKDSGSMIVGFATGTDIHSIGFVNAEGENDLLTQEGDMSKRAIKYNSQYDIFQMAWPHEIKRTLTSSVDTYNAGKITFKTYTPYTALPDPEKSEISKLHCIPGILMEIIIDATKEKEDVTAFFGYGYPVQKMVYAKENEKLLTLSYKNEWVFASEKTDDTYLIRGLDAADQLMKKTHVIQQNGLSFICKTVKKGETGSLFVTFSAYKKDGSYGTIETDYYYSTLFSDVYDVASTVLSSKDEIIKNAKDVDVFFEGTKGEKKAELFYQAVRSYYASSQLLIDKERKIHFSTGEGAYLWRNTMDLCADHITYELKRNPWVIRSMMDDFLNYYTYEDEVTFDGKEGVYPGGISFTHDCGSFLTYERKGYSSYERVNDDRSGFYFYMTTEELLNGIYCILSYVIKTGDYCWLQKKEDLLLKLLQSLENRDGISDKERNGILKAVTTRGGKCKLESTTYDALDHSLLEASGNLYVFIKTWCALHMMKTAAKEIHDENLLVRIEKMISKCQKSKELFESESYSHLKANAYKEIPGAVSAALEPLCVPFIVGALKEEDDEILFDTLRKHMDACMKEGVCIDEKSHGLRLSSTSKNTWPSKSALTLFAAREILKMEVPEELFSETISWAQESASIKTISDQIISDTREVIGAMYYPRIVTAVLWL